MSSVGAVSVDVAAVGVNELMDDDRLGEQWQ